MAQESATAKLSGGTAGRQHLTHPLWWSTGISAPTPAYQLKNTDYLKLFWGFPSRKFSTLCKMGGLGQLRSRLEYLPVSLTEPSPVLITRYKITVHLSANMVQHTSHLSMVIELPVKRHNIQRKTWRVNS